MSIFNFFKNSINKPRVVASETKRKVEDEWKQIDILLKGKGPSQLRQALIKADKSLDNVLKDIVQGDNMGERLKNAKDKFDYQTYDKLWKAHKIRNRIVHETGFEPPYHSLQRAVKNLKNGIKKLGVSL